MAAGFSALWKKKSGTLLPHSLHPGQGTGMLRGSATDMTPTVTTTLVRLASLSLEHAPGLAWWTAVKPWSCSQYEADPWVR